MAAGKGELEDPDAPPPLPEMPTEAWIALINRAASSRYAPPFFVPILFLRDWGLLVLFFA